jgi:hypothetical protein
MINKTYANQPVILECENCGAFLERCDVCDAIISENDEICCDDKKKHTCSGCVENGKI